jgi:hypothetical protein
MERRKTSLTLIWLGFFTNIVMAISLKSSINKDLGGLGMGYVS